VPTFDDKQEDYEKFEMQWDAFDQVEGSADALFPKGHPSIQTDHNNVISVYFCGTGQGNYEM
jgi:hypothetical protein